MTIGKTGENWRLIIKDIITHSIISSILVIIIYYIPREVSSFLIGISFFYFWELGQRIAKDKVILQEERRGADYWWDIRRWGSTARKEALIPIIPASIVYLVISIFL